MRRGTTPLLLIAALCAWTPAARAERLPVQLQQRVRLALERGEVAAAEVAWASLSEAAQQSPDGRFLRGLIRFYAGAYAAAAEDVEAAIAAGPRSANLPEWRQLRQWVVAARDTTAQYKQATSPDGRFVIRYAPGPDEILVPYALDALRRADAALSEHLATHAPGPIRLEIYPDPESLAAVSSLTVEHIQTSGTVALCKWNRLMIASPRSLLHGYPWLDTIAHELTHLLLTRASRNRAPVWFHEGTAKLLERTWRGERPSAGLSLASELLLVDAAKRRKLMPFSRLHPSIAMLPSQEEAALAFAQVATFLERFHRKYGDEGLQRVVAAVAGGADVRVAIGKVARASFTDAVSRWRKALVARRLPDGHAAQPLKRRFLIEGAEADESLDVAEARARRHLRLGDLLWGRARRQAAAREYERAYEIAPGDPVLASRLARASLASGQPGRALEPLRRALKTHPDHAPLHALLGAALVVQGQRESALAPLREALRLNPFNPAPHCDLARATRDAREREREEKACRRLGGPRPAVHTAIAPAL